MFACLAAVLLGIFLNDFPLSVAIGILCIYALLVFLFFFLSDRLKDFLLTFILPGWYMNLMILLGLLPFLFMLSYCVSGRCERAAFDGRRGYEILYEAGEKECIVTGIVKERVLRPDRVVLKLEDCIVKGYSENIERTAGGCSVYIPREGSNEEFECGDRIKAYGTFYFTEEVQNNGEYDRIPKSLSDDDHAGIYAKS